MFYVMTKKQDEINLYKNLLIFTLDEYSTYQKKLDSIESYKMSEFIRTMDRIVSNWKETIMKCQSELLELGYCVYIKKSSKSFGYEVTERTSEENT